uniref:Uncharacterized protein MANES_01G151000 n=1 Tax=Rhizophora mucronata TaxID=61149 RepID=A0A2P2KW25_RHIMU
MSLHFVAKLQMMVTTFLQVAKVKSLSIISNDIFCPSFSRWRMWSILNKLLQPFNVVWSHSFWIREIQSNTPWYSKLINVNDWIRCNNCPCREVHTLSHQVAPNSAFLGLKPTAYGFDRPSRSLSGPWLSRQLIVEIRGHVKLQQLCKLGYNMCRSTTPLLSSQILIVPNDHRQLMCQVVLTPG